MRIRTPIRLALLALLWITFPPLLAQDPEAESTPAEERSELAPEYRQWLESVAALISEEEREFFLGLRLDYQRDAFIEAFWRVRDPDPRTPVNELRRALEEFSQRSGEAATADPRNLMLLLNGPPRGFTLPDGRSVSQCFSRTREIEIWFYSRTARVERELIVIFYRPTPTTQYQIYRPGMSVRTAQRSQLPTTEVQYLCADELLDFAVAFIGNSGDYEELLDQALRLPQPSPEWLASFAASTTELPAGAHNFDADLDVKFPSRNQSRTTLQAIVQVPESAAPGRIFDGQRFHSFLLTGEVISGDQLFESFQYRFDGATPDRAQLIPLGFTRFLRPGHWTLRLLVHDTFGDAYAHFVREVDVPSPEGRPQVERRELDVTTSNERPIELLPPPGAVHAGLVRFNARARGDVDRVAFFLDDRQVLSKGSAPYSVELDLGAVPQPRRVSAVAYAGGQEVGTDQLWLNQGTQRFRVSLLEPRPGGIYPGSLVVRADVATPEGTSAERVEVYADDRLLATDTEAPYVVGLTLPSNAPVVVRVVAYLADGTSAEDAVVVNTASIQEAVRVELVTVPVLVHDRAGNPVRGLTRELFRVVAGGQPRPIVSFEESTEASSATPLRVALLVDRSISMQPRLAAVREAVGRFATQALRTEADRVALLSFADQPSLDVGWSGSAVDIERGLANLTALGGTALFDAIVRATNEVSDVAEAGAVVVFTDGEDQNSRMTIEQTERLLEGSSAALYVVGLQEAFADRRVRERIEALAARSGGRLALVSSLDELDAVYAEILAELSSHYLLTIEPLPSSGDAFVPIEVRVDREGVAVRSRAGYRR
jgi:VWFA-related protein